MDQGKMGSNFMDELDCGSFFDHIDDLIQFPPETESAGDCKNFPTIWNRPLPDSDPVFSGGHNNLASDLSVELALPYEDIIQLEWLSTFMEDNPVKYEKENIPVNNSPVSVLPSGRCGVQRARSKRPRPSTFTPRPFVQLVFPTGKLPEREKKRKVANSFPVQAVRKCLHCEITKTPQWRSGPAGPKTLCNACGVRYKSGRLFPEYRPAASPSFVPSLHSNSHRKVVEMRSKAGPEPECFG